MTNGKIVAIPRIRNDGRSNLRQILAGLDQPAVLQGFIDDWQALSSWTPGFFAERYGDRDILIETSSQSPIPTDPAAYLGARRYETALLGDTIHGMQSRGCDHGAYITYAAIYATNPELKNDIAPLHELHGFPCWMPSGLRRRLTLRPGFWLGPAGISSPMHFDRHENLNVQIYGRKRWVLFSPRHSADVYYRQSETLPVIFSPIDMTQPDLRKFPRLASAPRHDFVLEAGEILYLPPGWWHFVESLSDSINVNYWWWSPAAFRTVCRVEWVSFWRSMMRRLWRHSSKEEADKPTSMPL
ncbi:cupin-like domain-containing protein [Chromobacterium amazonense]|uniref:cupin-like domain-containing protein n=1 Tax=Chromobacterium amazonense TaxID=1382803 RepID=UPI00237D9AFB|nr:cupin-like domain-containing protein [Chromobacterium amazonense]MDE1715948.1 cupin-like domain-containing protein [Chromobacterium amazonense]